MTLFHRNERGERRVSPRLHRLLLVTHISTSVGWLGVVFAKVVLAVTAATASSAEVSGAMVAALGAINGAFAPLSLGAIGSGVLLSLGTRWGLLRHAWVLTKLGLTVGVIGSAVQATPRLLGLEPAPADLFGLPWVPGVLLAIAAVHLVLLGLATVLSVYKPWGKTWFGRRGDLKRQHQSPTRTAVSIPVSAKSPAQVERAA